MPRSVNAFRGAMSGAMSGAGAGTLIGGPLGTTIGAVVGGVSGLLGGAFSKSDEEIRAERIRDLIKRYNEMKAQEQADLQVATQKNIGKVNQFATGQKSQSNAGIARRSASQGRGGDNEAYILSSENNINNQASGTLQNIVESSDEARRAIDKNYNSLIAGAEYDNASAPIGPQGVDVLETLAGPAMNYMQNNEYINTLKMLGKDTGTPAPSSSSKYGSDLQTFLPDELKNKVGQKSDNVVSLGGSVSPFLQNNNPSQPMMSLIPRKRQNAFGIN